MVQNNIRLYIYIHISVYETYPLQPGPGRALPGPGLLIWFLGSRNGSIAAINVSISLILTRIRSQAIFYWEFMKKRPRGWAGLISQMRTYKSTSPAANCTTQRQTAGPAANCSTSGKLLLPAAKCISPIIHQNPAQHVHEMLKYYRIQKINL